MNSKKWKNRGNLILQKSTCGQKIPFLPSFTAEFKHKLLIDNNSSPGGQAMSPEYSLENTVSEMTQMLESKWQIILQHLPTFKEHFLVYMDISTKDPWRKIIFSSRQQNKYSNIYHRLK